MLHSAGENQVMWPSKVMLHPWSQSIRTILKATKGHCNLGSEYDFEIISCPHSGYPLSLVCFARVRHFLLPY